MNRYSCLLAIGVTCTMLGMNGPDPFEGMTLTPRHRSNSIPSEQASKLSPEYKTTTQNPGYKLPTPANEFEDVNPYDLTAEGESLTTTCKHLAVETTVIALALVGWLWFWSYRLPSIS